MPRKYHRPPDTTTKRRKPRKTAIPYEFPTAPVSTADENGAEGAEAVASETSGSVAVGLRPARVSEAPARDEHGRIERHMRRDYSYVRGEVIRIVLIAGFLIIALIITSFFR